MELHGGAVTAASGGVGGGSGFTIRLPRSAGAGNHAEAAAAEPPTRPRQVLVVDDSRDAGDSLASLLGRTGHRVGVARSGPQAIESAHRRPPEVAVLDIGRPGMSGYELAGRLRAGPSGGGLLLIALTGYGQGDDRRRAAAAGFDHHLTKPADAAVLASLIAEHRVSS